MPTPRTLGPEPVAGPLYLGVDTSFYTTSLAVVDAAGRPVWDRRLPLPVQSGSRGLRPSDVTFFHLKHLNGALWPEEVDRAAVAAVAASTRPRPMDDSYLPFFLAGEQFARAVAASLDVPFYEASHQEMHIRAGLMSARGPTAREFLAWHVSGGTTDLLCVRREAAAAGTIEAVPGGSGIMRIEAVGGSRDLHAGQFVDRVGVALGLPFPAGPSLERLALSTPGAASVRLPASVQGNWISFSGPESAAQRHIARGADPAAIAAAVQDCIADSLVRATLHALRDQPVDVLVSGGVAANAHIRQFVSRALQAAEASTWWVEPHYATDNAVGTALAAMAAHRAAKGEEG